MWLGLKVKPSCLLGALYFAGNRTLNHEFVISIRVAAGGGHAPQRSGQDAAPLFAGQWGCSFA